MSKLDEANAKLDELQAKVDAHQAADQADRDADAAVVASMQAEIDALKAAGTNGLTPAEVDGLIARLDAISADVAGSNDVVPNA